MTAQILREAAALMRERAVALPSEARWELDHDGPFARIYPADSDSAVATMPTDHADYFASWHPAVALAVADLLDVCADFREDRGYDTHVDRPRVDEAHEPFFAVARAYLGRPDG